MNDNNKVSKNIVWSVIERLCSQGLYFIVSIILARLIAPDLYGVITIVTVFVNLCAVVVQSGFSSALIYADGDDTRYYSTALWSTLLVTGALYIIMFFGAPVIASFYEEPVLILYIRVMAIQFVLQGIQSIPFAYVSKHMLFRENYIATFCGVIIAGIISILLAFFGLGIWALMCMTSIEVIIATIVLWLKIRLKISFSFDKKICNSMLKYCWKLVAVDLLNSIYSSINSIIIGKKFSKADVAYYNKSYNLPQTMFGSVNTAISKVLFPVFAEKDLDKKDRLRMIRRANRTINYILFPMLVGLAVIAHPFVIIVFTEKWSKMIIYLQIMCFVWMFQPIQTSAIQMFKAIGKSEMYLKLEFIKKICAIIILAVFILWFGNAIGLAWALLVGQILSVLMNFPLLKRYLGYEYIQQAADLCIPLVLCLIMAMSVLLVGSLVSSELLKLLVEILVGVVVYVLISIITKNKEFRYVMDIINSIVKRN